MPERDNDRLEQFFRKAAAKADVTFNEADWMELERRLDAEDLANAGVVKKKQTGARTAATIAAALLISTVVWLNYNDNTPLTTNKEPVGNEAAFDDRTSRDIEEKEPKRSAPPEQAAVDIPVTESTDSFERSVPESGGSLVDNRPSEQTRRVAERDHLSPRTKMEDNTAPPVQPLPEEARAGETPGIVEDERRILPDNSERNKQKAVVELPGAEEEETREALATVEEQHASDRKRHVAASRLSLLLSFAPDFSGVSMGMSFPPGRAFGAMIHYHPFERWSISAGAVRNYKVYSAAGEDYSPPKGYWDYYTNGVVPETIDGSCSILEFPLMIRYTALPTRNGRVNVAMGVSSYLMQSESYRYHFNQPNPGSRDGWDSRGSSRFFFNMLNIAVGYERQIVPGLMLGIEPYAKIPLEEIGWSNLRLFSSGAAFTLRYTIVHRKDLSIAARSRPPD